MSPITEKIWTSETLADLKTALDVADREALRKALFHALDPLLTYQNMRDWNRLVRVCEALALISWGERTALEANRSKAINGAWKTRVQNQKFESYSERHWRTKSHYFILEDSHDDQDYGETALASQRNLLPKTPIRWILSGNSKRSDPPLFEALQNLRPQIIDKLCSNDYGEGFSYLGLHFNFSRHSDPYVKNEYFHSENDVPPDQTLKYWIKPRLKLGRLTQKNGYWHIKGDINFSRAFSEKTLQEQKINLARDFENALKIVKTKLKNKLPDYDVERLSSDLQNIMKAWI